MEVGGGRRTEDGAVSTSCAEAPPVSSSLDQSVALGDLLVAALTGRRATPAKPAAACPAFTIAATAEAAIVNLVAANLVVAAASHRRVDSVRRRGRHRA